MKKIAFAFFLLIFGFFALALEKHLGESIFSVFIYTPFFGIPFAIWGLFDKNK